MLSNCLDSWSREDERGLEVTETLRATGLVDGGERLGGRRWEGVPTFGATGLANNDLASSNLSSFSGKASIN